MLSRRLCRLCTKSCFSSTVFRVVYQSRSTTSKSTTAQIDFSTEDKTCAALKWASLPSNHELALVCLRIPPRPASSADDDFTAPLWEYKKWEDYWKHRKWVFPVYKRPDRVYGFSLATHIMTTPMTLFSALEDLLLRKLIDNESITESSDSAEIKTIRWCCLGARSESVLPLEYWEELMYLINMRILSHATTKTSPPCHIVLDFVGPEMNVLPDVTVAPYPRNTENGYDESSSSRLTLRWPYKGVYHKYVDELRAQSAENVECYYDAFILLNPGIGHTHLMSSWEPTLELLFRQYCNPFGCSILFTAHSELDAKRDHLLLKQYVQKCELDVRNYWTPYYRYDQNPFASRISYVDPIVDPESSDKEPHILSPNQYRAIFPRLSYIMN